MAGAAEEAEAEEVEAEAVCPSADEKIQMHRIREHTCKQKAAIGTLLPRLSGEFGEWIVHCTCISVL